MTILKCETCGAQLKNAQNGVFKCSFCGTLQTLPTPPSPEHLQLHCSTYSSNEQYEHLYLSGLQCMEQGQYEEGYQIFSRISDYKDSAARVAICKKAALELCKENTYQRALALAQEQNIYFLTQAADLLAEIPDYKDSLELRQKYLSHIHFLQEELNRKNVAIQRIRQKQKNIKRLIVLAVVVILFLAILLSNVFNKLAHKADSICVEITSATSKYDNRYNYVYFEYFIQNDSKETVDYIEIVAYFKEPNGKLVGTLATEFGSYNGAGLNLESKDSILQESYISESRTHSSLGGFFARLYENGLTGLTIEYEILHIKWTDGRTYDRNS